MSAAAFRRGHRPSPSSGASSSQINAGLARDLALNHAYNELGKELFSSSLKAVGNYSLGRVIGEGPFSYPLRPVRLIADGKALHRKLWQCAAGPASIDQHTRSYQADIPLGCAFFPHSRNPSPQKTSPRPCLPASRNCRDRVFDLPHQRTLFWRRAVRLPRGKRQALRTRNQTHHWATFMWFGVLSPNGRRAS